MNKQTTFADFGEIFQERIVQSLVLDPEWSESMIEILKIEYFDVHHLSYIVSKHFEYFNKYRTFPSIEILKNVLGESLDSYKFSDEVLIVSIRKFLKKVLSEPDLNDLPYVKEKTFNFCKTQAMKLALEKSVDLIAQDKLDSVLEVMKTAMMAGEAGDIGHDFDEDMEERFHEEIRCPIPTGIPELDDKDVLRGGLDRGRLGLFIAPNGIGKSHFLVQMGASAILQGFNVLHVTLEMDQIEAAHRYDAHITGIDSREIVNKQNEVRAYYKKLKDNDIRLGRLFIKEFPSGVATANTISTYIKKLEMKKKVKIHLLVVDYAGEMKSIEHFDSASEGRHKRRAVLRDLRNLGREQNPRIPVWTAIQSNVTGAQSEIITGENAGEGFSQSDIPDVIFTANCKRVDKNKGLMMGFLDKQRGGNDGISFPMHVDKKISRFTVIPKEKYMEMIKTPEDEENDYKKELKNRLKNINKDLSSDISA